MNTDVRTKWIKANNNYNVIKMATSTTGLQTDLNDEEVKPREGKEGVAAVQPATVAYLSAAAPPQLARRRSAGNMKHGRLRREAPPSQMLTKAKVTMAKRSSVAAERGQR